MFRQYQKPVEKGERQFASAEATMKDLKAKAKKLGLTDAKIAEYGNRSYKDTYEKAIAAASAGVSRGARSRVSR